MVSERGKEKNIDMEQRGRNRGDERSGEDKRGEERIGVGKKGEERRGGVIMMGKRGEK